MNSTELKKLLSDIARRYQDMPAGTEKDEIWQLILKMVKILFGDVKINEIKI